MTWRASTRDARGCRIVLCRRADLPASVPGDVHEAVGGATPAFLVPFAVAWLLAFATLAFFALRAGDSHTGLFDSAVRLGGVLVMGMAPLILIRLGSRFIFGPAAIRACLRLRRCPSCAYDLATLTPEPDGCTVCPECGAAWRLAGTVAPPVRPTPVADDHLSMECSP